VGVEPTVEVGSELVLVVSDVVLVTDVSVVGSPGSRPLPTTAAGVLPSLTAVALSVEPTVGDASVVGSPGCRPLPTTAVGVLPSLTAVALSVEPSGAVTEVSASTESGGFERPSVVLVPDVEVEPDVEVDEVLSDDEVEPVSALAGAAIATTVPPRAASPNAKIAAVLAIRVVII